MNPHDVLALFPAVSLAQVLVERLGVFHFRRDGKDCSAGQDGSPPKG